MSGKYLLPVCIVIALGNVCRGQEPGKRIMARGDFAPSGIKARASKLVLPVDLTTLPDESRENVAKVLDHPTLTATAPAEDFCARGSTYLWLLDHPDRVAQAWRRVGIPAVEIQTKKDGSYCWKDDQGSELTWKTLCRNGEGRLWYAEGKVRPGALLPVVPVKAVAVLRHGIRKSEEGDSIIRHQVEVFLQTDSKTATVVMRLMGPAAPKMAEQGAEQLLMFFSGIARYVEKYPAKAEKLFADSK